MTVKDVTKETTVTPTQEAAEKEYLGLATAVGDCLFRVKLIETDINNYQKRMSELNNLVGEYKKTAATESVVTQ